MWQGWQLVLMEIQRHNEQILSRHKHKNWKKNAKKHHFIKWQTSLEVLRKRRNAALVGNKPLKMMQ